VTDVAPTSNGVLVTGAAGFIGSHLVERLLANGERVIGVDNFDPFYPRWEKDHNLSQALANPAFTLVEADCTDLLGLAAATGGHDFDVVIHLAARAGVRPSLEDPVGYSHTNVTGTTAVLELARMRGARRFVFGSSSSVYGNNEKVPFSESDAVEHPISPYAATKRAGELTCAIYAQLYGFNIIALRFFTVYGPRQRPDLAIRKFGTLMLNTRPIPVFGDGSTERDYTWIDDIISGVMAAVERTADSKPGFDIINLGESRTTSLSRLIELLALALEMEPVLDRQPLQPGDVQRTFADVSKARALLGYEPTTPVERGIPLFATWLKQHLED
jgi:UDP-glucuronate 4-epimerase